MKKRVVTLFAVVAIICNAHYSFANGSDGYIGIGFGQSSLDISDPGADKIDDTDTSLKIFGGFDLNPNFSAEFTYIDFGKFSAHFPLFDEADRTEGNAFSATAIGRIKIAEKVHLFGKLGFAFWNVDLSANATVLGTPISASGDGNGIDPLFGVGISFSPTNRVSVRVDWEQYKDVGDGTDLTVPGVGSVEIDGEDVDVIGGALIYSF